MAETVRTHPRPGSNSLGNITAFAAKGGGGGAFYEDDISPTLSAHGNEEGGQPPAIAIAGPLGGGNDEQADHAVSLGQTARRLTPTECERLQALPDGWTTPGPDGRRYAGLGDAVTASVAEWIGSRIMVADGTPGDSGAVPNPSDSSPA